MRSRRLTVPHLLLLLLSGCAETDFMTAGPVPSSNAGPPSDRSGEATGRRNASAEQKLDQMNRRLNEVDNRVQGLEGGVAGAQKRADEAARKADSVDGRLTRLWTNRFNQQSASSLEVYFSPDSIELTDAAQTVLVWVAKEMEDHPTLTVELGGYTDPKGGVDYN